MDPAKQQYAVRDVASHVQLNNCDRVYDQVIHCLHSSPGYLWNLSFYAIGGGPHGDNEYNSRALTLNGKLE